MSFNGERTERPGNVVVSKHVSVHASSDIANYVEQDAQLSHRDRAAGFVIVFAKSRTLELGDNILRTL